MNYFVEEKHTNKEFIWVYKNRVQFGILMIVWFFVLYFLVMLVVLTLKGKLNPGILTFIGVVLFFIGYLGLAQVLNKFFDVKRAWWKAKRQGKKINIEFKGNNQIIRIEK